MRPSPTLLSVAFAAATAAVPSFAHAEDSAPVAAPEEAPPPAIVLRYVPANFAWDAGLRASFGQRVQFDGAPPWLGIGAHFGWGKLINDHRVGLGFAFTAEGELAVLWSNIFSPSFQWDYVTPKGFYVGANVGPALMLNTELSKGFGYDLSFDAAPEVAVRLGWSQRFSLIAKRFYVALEPRLRVVRGRPEFVGALVVGSGKGY